MKSDPETLQTDPQKSDPLHMSVYNGMEESEEEGEGSMEGEGVDVEEMGGVEEGEYIEGGGGKEDGSIVNGEGCIKDGEGSMEEGGAAEEDEDEEVLGKQLTEEKRESEEEEMDTDCVEEFVIGTPLQVRG